MACNKCNKSRCECNKCTTATPTPFYDDSCICEEDNCQKIYIQEAALGLRIESSWNVPLCGGAAFISVPNVSQIPVGEYIHNATFGYFLINSFDSLNRTISITNTCLDGNAPVGTEVPACTVFSIGPPPCCTGTGQIGVFVAFDFTAPADSTCIDIIVTSEEGLGGTGTTVQIGTGVYRISAIKTDNVITICNDGEGIIPGTPVVAKDIGGLYQYPVIPVGSCCEDLKVSALYATTNLASATYTALNQNTDTPVATLSITNSSTTKTMQVQGNFIYNIEEIATSTTSINTIRGQLSTNVNGAGYTVVKRGFQSVDTTNSAGFVGTVSVQHTNIYTIAPGATLTVLVKGNSQIVGFQGGSTTVVANCSIEATLMAVAL